MNEVEWQTRKQRIDTRRTIRPPWKIIRYQDGLDFAALDGHAVEELPTANGPADYGLFVGGRLLGMIEAKKVTVTHPFTTEQKQWLSLIQEHLIQNLSIDEEDFDSQPLLTGRGGKARARQIFEGRLEPVIELLNAAVAA